LLHDQAIAAMLSAIRQLLDPPCPKRRPDRQGRTGFLRAARRARGRTAQAQNITQVQLAEMLGVSQQTVNAYEMGHRRIPVSSLPLLAETRAVSIEELLGTQPAAKKRGPRPKLQQQIERIQRLPKAQQRFVMQMLDTGFTADLDETAKRATLIELDGRDLIAREDELNVPHVHAFLALINDL
jgi:transcriptional regulator with XRE-family HTH domain